MMNEISALEPASLEAAILTRWFPLITVANNDYKEVAKVYISESSEVSDTEPAGNIAPELIEALEE